MRGRESSARRFSLVFDYHRHRDRLQAFQNAPIIPTGRFPSRTPLEYRNYDNE